MQLVLRYLWIETKSGHVTVLIKLTVTAALKILRAVTNHKFTVCIYLLAGREAISTSLGATDLRPRNVDNGIRSSLCYRS